jgi:hypothetical protein
MAVNYISIALRVTSSFASVDLLEQTLDCHISKKHKAGDPISKGNQTIKHEENMTIIDKKYSDGPLFTNMVTSLEYFTQLIGKLSGLPVPYAAEIFIGIESDNGQGDISLNHDILKQLADLKIDIIFDLYC